MKRKLLLQTIGLLAAFMVGNTAWAQNTFKLVTAAEQLTEGCKVIFVGKKDANYFAAGKFDKEKSIIDTIGVTACFSESEQTFSNLPDEVDTFTVSVSDNKFKFLSAKESKSEDKYLGWEKGKKNTVSFSQTGDYILYTIEFAEGTSAATITLVAKDGSNDRMFLYNFSSPRFCHYNSTSTSTDYPFIYKLETSTPTPPPETPSIAFNNITTSTLAWAGDMLDVELKASNISDYGTEGISVTIKFDTFGGDFSHFSEATQTWKLTSETLSEKFPIPASCKCGSYTLQLSATVNSNPIINTSAAFTVGEQIAIYTLRTDTANDGTLNYKDKFVRLKGQVTALAEKTGGKVNFTMQHKDDDHNYIGIYCYNAALAEGITGPIQLGDSVLVEGKVGAYNGLNQIASGTVTFLKHNDDYTESPVTCTVAQVKSRAYESMLVSLDKLRACAKDSVVDAENNGLKLHTTFSKDTLETGRLYKLTGVMGRYKNAFQLLLRKSDDAYAYSNNCQLATFKLGDVDVLTLGGINSPEGATKYFDDLSSVSGISVTAADSKASVKVTKNSDVVASENWASLTFENNDVITVTVTAEDQEITNEYKVTVKTEIRKLEILAPLSDTTVYTGDTLKAVFKSENINNFYVALIPAHGEALVAYRNFPADASGTTTFTMPIENGDHFVGKAFVADGDDTTFFKMGDTIRVVDTLRPTASFTPANGAADVEVDVQPTIQFDEDVWYTGTPEDGMVPITAENIKQLVTITQGSDALDFTAEIETGYYGCEKITLKPVAPLAADKPCTIKLNNYRDLAGNKGPAVTVTFNLKQPAPTAEVLYVTGFEADEGFDKSTIYNNDTENLSGPDGKQWATLYGTPTTSGKITGEQSMQMRWYTSSPETLGYTKTNFTIGKVTKVTFKAKYNKAALNLLMQYSVDEGESWIGDQSFEVTKTASDFEYVVSEEGIENVRIRFNVELPTTVPTQTSHLTIDEVNVYGFPTAPSALANITSFKFAKLNGVDVVGEIDKEAHTVKLEVDQGTDVTALKPEIKVSTGATISPASGVEQDFTNPVTYTVTAEDGTTQTWTVSVAIVAEQITKIYDIQYTDNPESDASPLVGQTVTTTGVVTACTWNSQYKNGDFVIQDGTGEYSAIYCLRCEDTVAIGDSLKVTGEVNEFKRQTQIGKPGAGAVVKEIIAHGKTLPEPVKLTTLKANNEAWESMLASVENAKALSHNKLDDGTGPLSFYDKFKTNVEILKEGKYNITGLLLQNDSVSISPRTAQDVEYLGGGQEPELLTISDIQYSEAEHGESPLQGQMVKTKGIVTACLWNSQFKNGDFVIQDGTDEYSAIYCFRCADSVAIGDEVVVSGVVTEYKGLTEIGGGKNTVILKEKLSTGNEVFAPVELSTKEANDEAWECMLVKVSKVTVDSTTFDDGSGQLNYFDKFGVHYEFDFEQKYDIVGVVLVYSDPQLAPRSADDIKAVDDGNSVHNNPMAQLSVYPNPFNGTIRYTGADICRVTISSVIGQIVLDQKVSAGQPVSTTTLPAGIYLVRFVDTTGASIVKKMIKR